MKGKDVEQFYNCYKHNLYEIKYIEKAIFAESYNYQKWESSLREKSQMLRNLYEDNEKRLNDGLRMLKNNEDEIDDELVTYLLQHIMYFVYEDHFDYEVTVKVLDLLEKYIEDKAQDWQKIKYYYIRGLMLSKGMTNDYEYPWYEKMSEICHDWTKADRNGSKERMLDAYLHRAICQLRLDRKNAEQYLLKLDEARNEWEKAETLTVMREIYGKDRDVEHYIRLRLELIDYLQVLIVSKENIAELSKERVDKLYKYLKREYKKGEKTERLNGRIFLAYHQVRFYLGEITLREYVKALDLFEKPSPYLYPDNMNFEMRGEDLYSCLEHDRQFGNSYTYALIILPEKFKYNHKKREDIIKDFELFICGLLPMENGADTDKLLVEALKIMSRDMECEEVFQMFETIMIHRQLPTAIHLSMVNKLVDMFITHIVEEKPEILIGLLDTSTVQDVQNKGDEIIDFVVKAGLCHDIGKLYCSDIINLQSRRITDEEFHVIKSHPLDGYKIANEIEAFKPYADVILGHHLFANKKGGYPQDIDIPYSVYTVITDLVTICDSIDAATDILGRNYTKGKTFRETVSELQSQMETRYSKVLVEILADSETLMKKMEKLTGEERATVYRDLYVRRVESLAYDKNYVEKNFRPYSVWDRRHVFKFIEDEIKTETEMNYSELEHCEEKYLIRNKKREIVGVFFGEKINFSNRQGVLIKLILIKNTSRHLGLGKKLLEYVEEKLRKKGYNFVAMERQEELGVMERYMWINGYKVNESGLLTKIIASKGE